MINSPSHAIELLGGPTALSRRMDRPFTSVASWGARQSIPIEEWPRLVELAAEQGVEGFTYEALVEAHAKYPRKRKPKPDAPADQAQQERAA